MMQVINSSYIYNLAVAVEKISQFREGEVSLDELWIPYQKLISFTDQTILPLSLSKEKAKKLIEIFDSLHKKEEQSSIFVLTEININDLRVARHEFETVLLPEWDKQAIFAVTSKRGYDTNVLVWDGNKVFETDLIKKVPTVLDDVNAACRCVAFELPTAAVFHLFRVLEAVVRRYLESLSGNAIENDNQKTLGAMLASLDSYPSADKKVIAALRDLKDLHRNPSIHPVTTISSVDEAIAVLNAIQTPITYMLQKIALVENIEHKND